ncbi:MAG: transcription-repair coupling factor [Desulfobacteraceae bacterium]|nr:transcription-repair coupling factor [Desulfobacteraceae bacterium]
MKIDFENLTTLKAWIRDGERATRVTGLSGSARSFFFAQFLSDFDRPALVILPEKKEAERLFRELQFFMSDNGGRLGDHELRLYEFLPYDMSPLTGLSPHREVVTKRLQALYALISYKNPVIITSLQALLFRVLPKNALVGSLEYLEVGEEVERDSLLRILQTTGYTRASLVEEEGDFSVRGGVIDVFSTLYPLPVRLEFWGDRLESMRQFDPLSQRSKNELNEMVLLPASEIIMDKENIERARSMGRLPGHSEAGTAFPGQEAWLNHFYPALDTLFEYLPHKGLITLFDPHRLESMSQKISQRFYDDVEKFRKEAAQKGIPSPETEGLLVRSEEISEKLKNCQRVEFSELDLDERLHTRKITHFNGPFQTDDELKIRLERKGRVSMGPLAEKISEWIASRARVVVIIRTQQQANRLTEILENYEVHVEQVAKCWAEIPKTPGLSICLGRLSKGFTWPDLGLYAVSEDEVFGPKRAGPRSRRKPRESALNWSSFSQLKTGDFVVHEEHGIGRYKALLKMEIANKINDFVLIEYAKNDKLYIPADRISILQKYAGAEERNPRLDQLGGHSWNIAKEKASRSVKRIARQLVELYALRQYRKGYAFSSPDNYYREFEATFEHEETDDQSKAVEDVLADMASERPMDRLVCGDVGFGKTEVALRAAFKAVSDGKEVAFLVPTTVLAEQHYETFKKRLSPYSIRVDILSRFKTKAEQAEIVGRLRSGKIDVLIGTHRMIQKDVKFGDLGLLIIDEEQRFGVNQKEKIKKYRSLVDVLAITATPIPRTFHMSMMGVRDLSIIETPPQDRHAIETYLSPYDESLITRAIGFELDRNGQIFFVHNRVRTIDHVADRLKQMVPRARFATAHGQMKARELEETMMRFLRKEVDVLVCTAIIESGLDIPSANTIIINNADRFGLAQIYQLRGRVGRAKEKAYAYLFIGKGSVLTKDAEKRLKALMDFTHLGAGLHLAMHDLKIRGGGNILGFSQSGHISAVGYELYLKLIERSVAELKGEEWHKDINPEINMDIPAFLPGDYVLDTDVRLNLYRRLSSLLEESELEELAEEIRDRFGPPSQEVENLLGLMAIRLLLKGVGVSRLDVGSNGFTLTFPENGGKDKEGLIRTVTGKPHRYQFLNQNRLKINVPMSLSPEDIPRIEKEIKALSTH